MLSRCAPQIRAAIGTQGPPWATETCPPRICNLLSTLSQVKGCFDIIGEAIRSAGGRGLDDVTITRMIAADPVADLEQLASAHKAVFKPSFERTGLWPANTTFGGTLVRDWIRVEIEATAVVGSTATGDCAEGEPLMIAELQVLPSPLGTASDEFAHVNAAITCIASSGLEHTVHALGTTVEGPADRVWAVARAAFDACLASGAREEMMVLKLYQGGKSAAHLERSGRQCAEAAHGR